MKKVIIFLFSLFIFSSVVYADPFYCYIGKDSNESKILTHNDEIKVYFKSTFDGYKLVNGKFKLYYDPYVFEIVKNNEEYVFYNENYEIKNVKVYSSIIEFEVDGKENEYNNDIYVKFKVKESAKVGNTTIELIKNKSSIKQILSSMIDDEEKSYEEDGECLNSKLFYEIKNESVFKNDAYLSYLDIDSDDGYMYPNFEPNVFNYEIYLNNTNNAISLDAVCAVEDCGIDDYYVGEVKKDINVTLKTNVGNNSEAYKIKIIVPKEDTNYEYPTLKDLRILKYNLLEEFHDYDNIYHVIVPDTEDSLLIDYESDYDVKIVGNENFKIGENVVVISVNNNDNINKYYIIVNKQEKEIIKEKTDNVKEEKEEINNQNVNKKDMTIPTIIIGLILLITLILITVFIVKDKQDIDIKG